MVGRWHRVAVKATRIKRKRQMNINYFTDGTKMIEFGLCYSKEVKKTPTQLLILTARAIEPAAISYYYLKASIES